MFLRFVRDGLLSGFAARLLSLPLFGEEALECDAGGLLLGLLFGGSFGLGKGAGAPVAVGDADLDPEELLVIGAALGGEDVLRLACSGGLEMLLEGGLVVADGPGEGVACGEGAVEVGDGGLDNVALDEGARGVEPAVEVERGDDGLESVGEECRLLATTALLFATAEAKQGSKADALGNVAEVAAADEGGAKACEFALAGVGEALIEAFGDDETQHGVADELKLLVIAGRGGGSFGVGLVGQRAVGEGECEELGLAEAMVEEGRERVARRSSCGLSTAGCHATL